MDKQILFIQGGGGQEDYSADSQLVESLKKHLGDAYTIHYPRLPEESSPDFGRLKQISQKISNIDGEIILVGHSLGASMLLKYLSEQETSKRTTGVFLISTPFWQGDEDWKEGFKLKEKFAEKLSQDIPVFLYHCRDDNEVPFEHLSQYAKRLRHAIVRELDSGGHQLNNDLEVVASDIKAL